MTDLYETLGVTRDANKAAIRAAYKRRAKQTHPDHGGDAEKFALVKTAHDTLLDPDRRATYDRTGEFGTKPPDNEQAENMNLLTRALDGALAALYAAGRPPREADMIAEMRKILFMERARPENEKVELVKNKNRTNELIERFSVEAEFNPLEDMLRWRLAEIEAAIASRDVVIGKIDRAIAYLGKFSFKRDQVSDQEMRRRQAEHAYANGAGILGAIFAGASRI